MDVRISDVTLEIQPALSRDDTQTLVEVAKDVGSVELLQQTDAISTGDIIQRDVIKDPSRSTMKPRQSLDVSEVLIDDNSHEVQVTIEDEAESSLINDNPDRAVSAEFMVIPNSSQRGRDKLVDSAGYTYVGRRRKSGTMEWKCDKGKKPCCCPARVVQKGPESFIRKPLDHCHKPQTLDHRAMTVIREIKARATADISSPPSIIVSQSLKSLFGEGQAESYLPTVESLRKVASRAQNMARSAGCNKKESKAARVAVEMIGGNQCDQQGKKDTDGCKLDVTESSSDRGTMNQVPCDADGSENTMPVRIMFQCEYCEIMFSQVGLLQSHKLKCSQRELHQCEYCPATFITFKELKGHQNIYTPEKPYQLGYCEKGFMEAANRSNVVKDVDVNLDSSTESGDDDEISRTASITATTLPEEDDIVSRVSTQERTAEGNFQCEICKKTCSHRYMLKKHVKTHTGVKPYKCDICGKFFSQHSHLKLHRMIHTGERPYPCRSCKDTFRYSSDRNRHEMRKHSKLTDQYQCEHCDKVFGQKYLMQIHKKTHFAVTTYHCKECNRYFKSRGGLEHHKNIHAGEFPFQCDICGKRLRQNLARHRMTHMKTTPFNCYVCGEGFQQITDFTEHKKIHTVVKSYQCDFCGTRFRTSSHLHSHRRIHTGEKPHKCKVCEKAFRVSSCLKKHVKIHEKQGIVI